MQYFSEIFFLLACRYITTYVHKCTLKWFELYFDGHYLKRDRKGKKGFCVKLTLTMVFLVRLPRVFFSVFQLPTISLHSSATFPFITSFFCFLFVFCFFQYFLSFYNFSLIAISIIPIWRFYPFFRFTPHTLFHYIWST